MTEDIQTLNAKVDRILEHIDAQQRRQQRWDDLFSDLMPIIDNAMIVVTKELDTIDDQFETADLIHLAKVLLSDAKMLTALIGHIETLLQLIETSSELSHPIMANLTEHLSTLEQRGYFRFTSNMSYVVDKIVTSFEPQELRDLGDNVVDILKTVKNATQPDVLNLTNQALNHLDDDVEDLSMWQLMQEMRDPEVRKGMSRMLHMLKGFAEPADIQ